MRIHFDSMPYPYVGYDLFFDSVNLYSIYSALVSSSNIKGREMIPLSNLLMVRASSHLATPAHCLVAAALLFMRGVPTTVYQAAV